MFNNYDNDLRVLTQILSEFNRDQILHLKASVIHCGLLKPINLE